jgi:hypothetical protein
MHTYETHNIRTNEQTNNHLIYLFAQLQITSGIISTHSQWNGVQESGFNSFSLEESPGWN